MKGQHYKENNKSKKEKLKKIFVFILLVIFISMMIYAGIKIFKWLKENKESRDIIEDVQSTITVDENSDNIGKYTVDFESLKQKNSETIAWLKVNGTDIDYPVLKTKNNDYYMTHSFDKSYNSSGWVFMDYKNKFDGTDKNTVIYGHNRRNGSIFGTLKNILKEEWQNNSENHIIPFITEKERGSTAVHLLIG